VARNRVTSGWIESLAEERETVRDHRVGAVLETEGIVNDVTAAILAVVIFDVAVVGRTRLPLLVEGFASRLGVGVLVGVLTGATMRYLLSRHPSSFFK